VSSCSRQARRFCVPRQLLTNGARRPQAVVEINHTAITRVGTIPERLAWRLLLDVRGTHSYSRPFTIRILSVANSLANRIAVIVDHCRDEAANAIACLGIAIARSADTVVVREANVLRRVTMPDDRLDWHSAPLRSQGVVMTADTHSLVGGTAVPLRVHVLFHHDSESARGLAVHLYRVLNGPSADWGLRIPVRFGRRTANGGPPALPELESARSLVVVLVDGRMARGGIVAERAAAGAWGDFLVALLAEHRPGSSKAVSILPVAVDDGAFFLSNQLADRSFVRLDGRDPWDARRRLELQVTIGCLRLLQGKPASEPGVVDDIPHTDIELFVSHTKADLPRQEWRGAVAALFQAHLNLPIEPWVDARDIPPGGRFKDEIQQGILRASALIIVLTDNYSNHEWCRREVLDSKTAGRPIIVVDALESRVLRLFPYIGNAPTVRWRAALAQATQDEPYPEPTRDRWEAEDASTVMLVALLEALRYQHEVARFQASYATADDLVLGTQPEAITVLGLPEGTTRVVYPDPPLGREELDRIRKGRPGLDMVTPLEQLARWDSPPGLDLVALSLSSAVDADRYGGSDEHLATMAHDAALYLLLAGLRLLYGGMPRYSGVGRDESATGDDPNFVERLMDLVERYSPLARQVGRSLQPIENWVAWPVHEELTSDERNLYRLGRAVRIDVPPPDDLGVDPNQLKRSANGRYPVNTPVWRYVRARSLSRMREASTQAESARVAMGGKLQGYTGPIPGVVEEALLTIRAGKPLYLLGAFGGAARLVIDLLKGSPRVELTSSWCEAKVYGWRDLVEEYGRRGHPLPAPEELADEIRARGSAGLQASLMNGLSERENEELTRTTDARRAIELVLGGLHSVSSRRP